MSLRLSRTKIARHAAQQLAAGNTQVIREIAAYLVDEGRTGEAELVIRSIYDELERDGIVVADVTTAHGLSADVKQQITKLLDARQLEIREHSDEQVLGGIRVQTPSRILDATVQNRLRKLRERKV